MNGAGQRVRGPGEMSESFDDAGDDDMPGDDGFPQPFVPASHHQGHQPQPRPQEARQPGGEPGRPERNERPDRPERQDRSDRPFRRDRDQGRPPRFGDRDRGERQGFIDRDRPPESRPDSRAEARGDGPERAPEQAADPAGESRRRDRFAQPHEQPEFLRRPVRRVRSSDSSEPGKSDPTGE
jgi:hypothetical protein